MDVGRAQEILNASEVIPVRHNGELVWIDGVDAGERTAQVHPQEEPGHEKRTVPVEQLEEVQ